MSSAEQGATVFSFRKLEHAALATEAAALLLFMSPSQPKLRLCSSVILCHPNANEDAYAIEFGDNIQQALTQECKGLNRSQI